MEPIIERCCGLDVHQETVVACLITPGVPGKKGPQKEVRTFATFTRELAEMRDWLMSKGCTHVGMESTGVYWMPVYAMLEDQFRLVVGNAHHIKNVPGRKTDVKDAEWIAELVRHGLIRASFVPPKPMRALRDMVRYRTKLVQTRSSERNRLLKLLETANIKLASVATDVFGVSGMEMLRAIAKGETAPATLAKKARGRLRKKSAELVLALEGKVEEHHRFLLGMQLSRLDALARDIAEVDAHLETMLAPYKEQQTLLDEIPGVDVITAAKIIAEMGVDMSVFPDEHQAAAWAGVAPGNYESAGKRKSGNARKGNVHLTSAFVEAALAATRAKGSYFASKYYQVKARRGHKRAIMAVAHKICKATYHILKTNTPYKELGSAYLDLRNERRLVHKLVSRLEALGHHVTLAPLPTDVNRDNSRAATITHAAESGGI